MSLRTRVFCILALLATVVFVRLGFWQLSRRHERLARNAIVGAQLRSAPVPFSALPHDTAEAHYRPVHVEGRFDYEHELVLANRSRHGSPGAELITPVRIAGRDTAVLVNRGWVYSPDGGTVDRARWREGDSAIVTGYAELVPSIDTTAAGTSRDRQLVRRITSGELLRHIPYPVAPRYVVSIGDTASLTHPVRRALPELDDGPHARYAVQWFAFAAIAIVGAGMIVVRERRDEAE
ncbi:MAG: SURF1 family protein [Gemmatimonadaceae bacterium]|nr:SURF1 family protein [Gemmatimonadaceae bacterium]